MRASPPVRSAIHHTKPTWGSGWAIGCLKPIATCISRLSRSIPMESPSIRANWNTRSIVSTGAGGRRGQPRS